jgi:arsenite methyltransferase
MNQREETMSDATTDTTPGDLKTRIRDHYAERAVAAGNAQPCGCSCGCSPAASGAAVEPQDELARGLYDIDETSELPPEAVLASLGCGNPTALADLRPGEVVLDLGSGGGIDVLLSARRIGPTGKAYGLDMTDEMLALARKNQATAGATNVEFLRGEIEHIPLPDASVDVIISNCVVNLSTDKDRALAEAYRVLKPGGRFAISDILFQGDVSVVPDELMRDVEAWSACIAGALEEQDFIARLRNAGFADPSIEVTNVYDGSAENNMCGAPSLPDGVRLVSGFVRATKPAAPSSTGATRCCAGSGCCG